MWALSTLIPSRVNIGPQAVSSCPGRLGAMLKPLPPPSPPPPPNPRLGCIVVSCNGFLLSNGWTCTGVAAEVLHGLAAATEPLARKASS
eukprot:363932-Chlamydomonas_euryale.AAC.14